MQHLLPLNSPSAIIENDSFLMLPILLLLSYSLCSCKYSTIKNNTFSSLLSAHTAIKCQLMPIINQIQMIFHKLQKTLNRDSSLPFSLTPTSLRSSSCLSSSTPSPRFSSVYFFLFLPSVKV